MTVLVPALGGFLFLGALIALIVGPDPVAPLGGTPANGLSRRFKARAQSVSPRTRRLLPTGVVIGLVLAAATGWVIAIVLVPALLVGLPVLLSAPTGGTSVERLQAMEEWARSLSGVLTAGLGLDQALIRSLRTTPDLIKPEVTKLAQRLWANWPTERALRAFADDLDDPTGDLIVGNLILGATRRGAGLAAVLEGLAESAAADVRARRQIATDQAKPRTTAMWVTVVSVAVLGYMAVSGSYIEPYSSPLGQILIGTLLTAYVLVLLWMKSMAKPPKLPRFLTEQAEPGEIR